MTCLINLALFISDWWIPGVVFLSTISKSVVHSLLQHPTLVKICAVTSVCSALVDTPAPAHKVPLQWNLILIFVMQVKKTKKLSAWVSFCTCVVSFTASRFAFLDDFIRCAWLLPCHSVKCVDLTVIVYSVYAWLLLLQPLNHLSPCLLHVDAWMVEHVTLMKVVCLNASEFNCTVDDIYTSDWSFFSHFRAIFKCRRFFPFCSLCSS